MNAWYLLYCKPKEEIRAQKNFELQNIQTYMPMVTQQKLQKGKKVIVKNALFPNYLFVKFDPKETSVATVKGTRGVSQLVDCKENMTPLCHLVFALRQQEKQLEMACDLNTGHHELSISPKPEFVPGELIRFTEGPFSDLEGIFEQKNGTKRCHVLLKILGQMKRTKVPLKSIASVKK